GHHRPRRLRARPGRGAGDGGDGRRVVRAGRGAGDRVRRRGQAGGSVRVTAEPLPGLGGVSVDRGVPCTMRDGVVLRADVYRPADTGRHPVLVLRLPYDRAVGESDVGFAHPSWFARHGYLVVVQDCRGRHGSDGEWYPFRDEAADGYDTVEWAARLPDANGRVGMYGFSYPGANQLQTAALRPPSLVTICPCFTTPQFYDGWTYNGGA